MSGVFWQYNGDSLYLAAFAVSLVLLYYRTRKRQNGIGKKAAAAFIFSLIFVFNEAAYWFVGKLTDTTTYYRFFWMLPILFLTAVQLTEAFTGGHKKEIITAAVLFVVCLCFGANFFFLNRQNINKPQNLYGLDPDAITAAEQIMADWNQQQTEQEVKKDKGDGQTEQGAVKDAGSTQNQPVVALDMYLEYQVRTYEPRIIWGISRKAYLYQAEHGYDGQKYARQQKVIAAVNEGIRDDSKELRRCLDKNGIDYLVIRTIFDMDSYLADISVLPIAQSENYTIYKLYS